LIDDIDRLRIIYVEAISQAVAAYAALCTIDTGFQDVFEHVPTVQAIDEMNMKADQVINAYAKAQSAVDDLGATFNIGGDMIQIGDITDSKNIAIGKDIEQEINE